MLNRSLVLASTILVAGASPALAQRVSWNDRAIDADTTGDAPMVRVMIEGPHVFGYGAPVRVRFSVSDDAYVIVARVDGNGHLTLLYPSNRRNTLVSAGEDHLVRGRRSGATFLATDRMSGGFVFAMASYDPFDLSRLTIRDFDRYVTGTYVGRPMRTYVGDPYRVITRFAGMVLYDRDSPFDYDVDFYQVDSPQFISSSGYSTFCSGYGYDSRFRSLSERWDDDLYYGDSSSRYGCNPYSAYCGVFMVPYFSYYGLSNACLGLGRRQIAGGPITPPTAPPGTDTTRRVNPWVGDSVARPDTVGRQPGDGRPPQPRLRLGDDDTQRIVREATQRPAVVDYDEGDRVFSIPGRALPGIRRSRDGASTTGTPPRDPGSRTPATVGDEEIRWVRPPRGIEREATGDGAIPRQQRRGESSGERDVGGGRRADIDRARLPNIRNDAPPRSAAPTRSDGPRFDSPPPSTRNGPEIHYSPPPARSEPSRSEPSRSEPVRSEPARVERRDPPPAPRSPPVREPASEKKPGH